MNRKQAEHLLDAYVDMENDGGDNKARISLREVILDAMTEVRYYPYYVNYPRASTGGDEVLPKVTWETPSLYKTGVVYCSNEAVSGE